MEIMILTVIILFAIVLFATRIFPIEVTAILTISALAFSGVLTPNEALQGFSSSATVTVAAMFVLTAGLARTGVVDMLASRMANYDNLKLPQLLFLLAGVVALFSAIANNTPVVIIMIPILMRLSRTAKYSTSKVFLPVSYFSILGGTCTVLGTSTNILIDDLFRRSGGPGFTIFDFTPLGSVYLIIGVVAIVILAPRLLPNRSSLSSLLPTDRGARFVTEFVLEPGSNLIGKRVSEVWGGESTVRLLEIIRGEDVILGGYATKNDYRFEANDALIVEGSPTELSTFLHNFDGVELASVIEDEHRVPMKTVQLKLVEAVILPDSYFIGRLVPDLGLNRLYGVKVMAIQRHGRQHRYQIRTMRLTSGDVLLLQVDDHGLAALRETGTVLVVEGVEQTVHREKKRRWAVGIVAAVIVAAAFFGVPLAIASLAGAALMIVMRCIRVDEAVRSLDLSTLLLLAGTIPLGIAMFNTGLAPRIVDLVIGMIGNNHPVLLISAIYLITAILTSFLSNSAAAVLFTPLAINLASSMGIEPQPLLMAVAFGASACFATPIGYQTNVIVMGPGGYTWGDYLRLGIPLTIIMWIAATILIPLFWPIIECSPAI
jgi:di/tricarboxylate transporter